MCYKPDMRKWMRDRFQRRKKKPAESSDQPAPPPLQPAYFDAEQQPATPDTENESSRESAPHDSEPQPESRPRSRGRSVRSAPAPHVEAPAADASPADTADTASADVPNDIPYQVPHAIDPPPPGEAARRPGSRRRRGGRGRSGGRGREQAVAQAFTPKGITPSVLPETDDSLEPVEPAAAAASPVLQAPRPPAAATVTQRAPKGIVVLAIGLPGSGKSSWFKRHSVVPLSSDMIRSLLFDDVREQRFQDLVFSNLRSMLKARLIAKRPTNYVDATNLTPQERQHWIKLAKDYNYEVHAIFFDVPLEVCIERHQRRDLVVPEDVMRRMAAKLKAPTFEEGFAKITVVRVKKKDDGVGEESNS
jgi:predicted kinase